MDDQNERNLRRQDLLPSDTVNPDSSGEQRNSFSPGQVIENRFTIVRELGRGGTGTVYQVDHVLLKKQYAMKILDPMQVNDEAWRRFQKEAQAAGLLDHPGFVKVHDFGLIGNQIPYFVMDLVAGDTLAQRLRKHGPMSVANALPIFIQLCFALDYAHSKGVIHRDLKPSNISLTQSNSAQDEQVKILDFGIAKLVGMDTASLTKVGSVFGTPFYMSPEQCMGQPVDRRCDIYSLGCVFFEMLAGAPPFVSENALTLMMQHQSEPPPSLKEVSMGGHFPAALEALIQKMLSKNPDERYQNLADAANDLIDVQQGKKTSITFAKTYAKKASGKSIRKILGSASVALILVICTALYFVQGKTQPVKAPVAQASDPVPPPEYDSKSGVDPVAVYDKSQANFVDVMSYQYFSTSTKRNGISYRDFKFPAKSPIGEISYVGLDKKHNDDLAVGVVSIPNNPGQPMITVLKVRWIVCKIAPNLLKKFRPDEVGVLTFEDDDVRRATVDDLGIFDDALSFVDQLTSIYGIELPTPVTDKSLVHLAKLHNLYYLNASGTQLTGGELRKLPILPRIRTLRISMIKNARAVLPALRHSVELKSLKMVADDLQNSDLKYLAGLPNLQEIVLRRNPKITDAGLTYLAGLPKLERLTLDGCTITPGAIKTLSKIKIGEFLCLDVSKWSKSDVAALLKAVRCDVRSWSSQHQRTESVRQPPTDNPPQGETAAGGLKGGIDRGE